jgi:threonine synthase
MAMSNELTCPRCGQRGSGFAGCPRCRAEGVPVNLVPPLAELRGVDLSAYSVPAVTLGEGNTPLLRLATGPDGGSLWVKDESRNPTGSHKDRAMAAGLAAARAAGATTVVAATSGNAGASAAAYAARAGLRCVVLTTTGLTGVLADQVRAFGAALAAFPDAATRNRIMQAAVAELGWYPLTNYVQPAAGGNPYANEGYKTIAYELAVESTVDVVVVPTSRADLLAGVERGYRELSAAGLVAKVPRLVAAEDATAAAFTAAMRQPDRAAQERTSIPARPGPSPAFSIGSTVPSWQGLQALWNTGGTAIALDVDDYMEEHRRLPVSTGLFLEASSAVGVAVARRLFHDGAGTVVALGTGSGLKGLSPDGPQPPLFIPADLDALVNFCNRSWSGS